MIKYTLSCDTGHAFEGWFSSGADFDRQAELGLVSCPVCGSAAIGKELMAPSVSTSRKRDESQVLMMDKARKEAIGKIRELVTAIRENAVDVGEKFPEEARKIHYGEAEQRGLIGKASVDEVRSLLDEGIEIAPLPVLPDDVN
ncbi:DUF1178 family protein [Pararhizobium gei]|uniref:DUF1178 family protein n=1 Tax=Pararhizobium gei TaxID=1395951 RepID=UPI0023DA48FD|nr:DUF1178 family protein [Rhizobium gei]